MEKKHHFQGFRKFSIKTRLVIALLMISIIPLVGISGYSFHIFSAALQEKLSASISQTLSMINLNMVSEIEKYQYLCGSICISEEIKKGLLKKDMTDMEKIPMEIFFMIWAMTGSIRRMWTESYRSLRSRTRMCGLMHILTVTEIFWFLEEGFTSSIPKAG